MPLGSSRQAAAAEGAAAGAAALAVPPASDHGVDLHALRAFRHQELRDRALIDGFDFHRRLVGLDLGDHVAGLDLVAFLHSHLARLPSSIVGDSAGMVMLIGMRPFPLSDR
jgi:hypothetical protein